MTDVKIFCKPSLLKLIANSKRFTYKTNFLAICYKSSFKLENAPVN